MQDRPICFHCDKVIADADDMVFEGPCGHDDCSSAVFHAICLFGWREKKAQMDKDAEEAANGIKNALENFFEQMKKARENREDNS
jgi:hypothetical protein